MGLSTYLNNRTLDSKFSDLLAKYDSDNNGFTKKEFSYALKDMTSIFARSIIKLSGYDKKLFKSINADGNDVVSYNELADYIKKEYSLEFDKIKNMTFQKICEEADKASKEE